MTNIYRLALQVQDASNISGVLNSLHTQVLPAIREEAAYTDLGTPYIERHPALILFLDKIVSLTRIGWLHDTDMQISAAYDRCRELAEKLDEDLLKQDERRLEGGATR